MLAIILGAAVLVGVAVSFYVVRDISRGIDSIVKPMQALGNGDLTAEVPHRGETTEIGAMADTLQVFKEALIAKDRPPTKRAAVDAEAKIERGRRVDSITRDFESMIGEIVETVSSASTQLEASAGTLSSTAERSQKPHHRRCGGFRGSLDQRAVGGVRHRRDGVLGQRDQPPGTGIGADGDREPSTRPARPTTASASCRRPPPASATYVELINTIAGQTNLLALNATIEGGARRRSRPWLRGGRLRSEGAGRTDRKGHRRDRPADHRHPGGHPGFGRRDQGNQRHHRAAVGNLLDHCGGRGRAGCGKPRKSRATCSRRPRAPSRCPPTSPTCSAAPPRPSASSQVLAAAQSLSSDSNRLKLEVGKFLSNVRAALTGPSLNRPPGPVKKGPSPHRFLPRPRQRTGAAEVKVDGSPGCWLFCPVSGKSAVTNWPSGNGQSSLFGGLRGIPNL